MKKLQAVIFDVDGTLAETERDGHRVAFNRAFEEAGLDWYWDEHCYGQLLSVTGGKERIDYYLSTMATDFQCDDIPDLIKTLHASKTRHYVSLLAQGKIGLRTGVARLIQQCRSAGLRLAIATTTTPENVTALITSTLGEAALTWFECIAAGDIVQTKKPAPDIYTYCLQQMALEANACLAFEDSGNGLESACGAGIPTVVTVNQYTQQDDFSRAVVVLDHLGDEGQPCQVLSGLPVTGEYVTINDLNQWHHTCV